MLNGLKSPALRPGFVKLSMSQRIYHPLHLGAACLVGGGADPGSRGDAARSGPAARAAAVSAARAQTVSAPGRAGRQNRELTGCRCHGGGRIKLFETTNFQNFVSQLYPDNFLNLSKLESVLIGG